MELKHIGKELQQMSEELRREMEVEDAQTELEDELATVNDRLGVMQGRLEAERAEKLRLQQVIESLSRHADETRAAGDIGHMKVRELEDQLMSRRSEIDALKEEKRVMKDWLDRGVIECQRVATDVTRLNQELQGKDKGLTQLLAEKKTVSEMLNKLNADVTEAQRELQRARHEKAILEGKVEDRESRVHISEEQRKTTMQECDRLSGEVTRLGTRVRDLEDTEIAMAGVSSSMKRLAFDLQRLNNDIQHRNVADTQPEDQPGYYEADDHARGNLRECMTVTRASTARIQDGLVALRSALKSKVMSDEQLLMQMQRELQAQAEQFTKEAARLRELNEAEKKRLQDRITELERQIGIVNDHAASAKRGNVSVLESITQENAILRERCDKYEKEQVRLKDKVNRLKLDWQKVDDTRRRYRQLERERDMLRDCCTKVEGENSRLREYLVSMQCPAGIDPGNRGPASLPSGPMNFMLSPGRATGATMERSMMPSPPREASPTRSVRSIGSMRPTLV
jgi:chromosome segregation ATPase